ncbi:MAG: gamma-glutamylcyclotransferase [Gammaproteobacteria bacterium]|nr:gamma-glutamylcyclotransferase [Gammaproteobacteria bacterium]MBU2057307.1 gamma-glutamylcyclotransferase [Gammaproteobacteria bacterium]MBU2174909.1 gamma-glutamylcyclotransferase [Gammaproteobacteria bacterium]MBU2245514.1 gamma-glutamylcyclotransferase [Gammaproteobacteria bacterium]MBU2344452.1 gamma-glutamylcyclotransferase [Gammaproteobacteria bacterium]
MKPDGDAVFVYGLLMLPEVVFAITGKDYVMQDASLLDYKRYGLSQQPGDTPVPALAQCPGYLQHGQVLLGVLPEELAKLDFFEELDSGLYLREKVRVQSLGLWLDAWCYTAGPALQPYLTGDWSLQQVSQSHTEHLITQLIPSMLTTYHHLQADTGAKTKVTPLSED